MRWALWIFIDFLFFMLGATGLADWVGGWFITPFALFGVFLMFCAFIGIRHGWELSGAICGLFASSPSPLPAADQPQQADAKPQLSPVASFATTVGANVMADLALLEHDIETKKHLLLAGIQSAQQQNLVKQAAANAEATQLKAMAAKVQNAA